MQVNIQEEYKRKLVKAEEAVRVVKSGDWVEYGFGLIVRMKWMRR